MACLAKIHNIRPALTAEVIQSIISDLVASSLSDELAAIAALRRLDDASVVQIITAAIGVLRQQAGDCEEAIASAVDLEREVGDLKDEIGELRAKLKLAAEKSAPATAG
jgi:hypothetical protein